MTAASARGEGEGDSNSGDAARGGGGSGISACGGGGGGDNGGDGGWTPFSTFLEQLLEREFTPFFLQMMARVCWGGGSVPLF